MDDQYTPIISAEERAARRARRAKLRRQRQRERRLRQLKLFLSAVVLVLILVILLLFFGKRPEPEPESVPETSTPTVEPAALLDEPDAPYSASETPATVQLGDGIDSSYAVLIDLQSDTILAEKGAHTVISPASMTKIMTLLVAAEHVTNLDDTFTMTIDITDYCYVNGCSVVGLDVGETVSIRELLYGTILPSGADASLGLAFYLAGSHEAFVEMMNQKAEELGIAETTHFTNCVGIYDEAHTSTVYDMAVILKAAMDNDLCREILRARTYETAPTPEHPDGQILSNWFLRRIEDHVPSTFEVIGAKTGYVVQSGSCAASCGEDSDGNLYICVTGDAGSSWRCIFDHVALYEEYCT